MALFTGCSAVGAQSTQPSQDSQGTSNNSQGTGNSGTSGEDLSTLPGPKMFPAGNPPGTQGELFVPDYCRATAVGLQPRNGGFLLVVQVEGTIPDLNDPPELPFGVLLDFIEIDLGVFAPSVKADLGGSYRYVRQYQTPDRPGLEVAALGSGKSNAVSKVNATVSGREIRVQLPDVGPNTDRVTQWGASVSCALRHPVDGFYFPTTRDPANRFDRNPLANV